MVDEREDNMTTVAHPRELTPEEYAEHSADETWADELEELFDRLLEDSDTDSLRYAYALTSMFVQSAEAAGFAGLLQEQLKELYEKSSMIRDALAREDLMNIYLIEYDEWMSGKGD